MKKYYTIYLGNNIWENVIDDMNAGASWARGGMIWGSRAKAFACMNDLKKYDFETDTKKFSIRSLVYENIL